MVVVCFQIVNKLLKLSKVNFSIALSRDEFQMSYNAKVTSAHIITGNVDCMHSPRDDRPVINYRCI